MTRTSLVPWLSFLFFFFFFLRNILLFISSRCLQGETILLQITKKYKKEKKRSSKYNQEKKEIVNTLTKITLKKIAHQRQIYWQNLWTFAYEGMSNTETVELKLFMLLVPHSKDHNYFHRHGIALGELCLLG